MLNMDGNMKFKEAIELTKDGCADFGRRCDANIFLHHHNYVKEDMGHFGTSRSNVVTKYSDDSETWYLTESNKFKYEVMSGNSLAKKIMRAYMNSKRFSCSYKLIDELGLNIGVE